MASVSKKESNTQACFPNLELQENSIGNNDTENKPPSVSVISQTTCDKTPEHHVITKSTRKIDKNKIPCSMSALLLIPQIKFLNNKYELFPIKKESEALLLYKINNKNEKIKNDPKEQKIIINKENIKSNKDGETSKICKKSDFKEKPPKLPQLYFHDYLYENKNIFSNLNESVGDINIYKNVQNIFYNHLITNKKDDKVNYLIASTNQRFRGKVLTYIYYSP